MARHVGVGVGGAVQDEPPLASEFSHNEEKFIPDPYTFYEKMRVDEPAYFSESIYGGTWLFFRHSDCLRLLGEERLSNSRAELPLYSLPPEERADFDDMIDVFERWLAFHDGASHREMRQHADRSYEPFDDAALEPRIQNIVDGLLDEVDPDCFDLMSEFAFPLPAMVIADVLGVPISAHADLTRWTDDIAHLFGSTDVSRDHMHRTRQSTRELVEFLGSPEAAAESERQDGLLHQLRIMEMGGHRFDERDVIAQSALLLFAGTASIRYLIGNSVYALGENHGTNRHLLTDDATAPQAIEELLRFSTPVQFVGRVVRDDFTYAPGTPSEASFKAGQPVLLYVASANRDAAKFDRPDELVLDRPGHIAHLTFGAGRHLCFGDPLVRQTTRIAMATLYRRFPLLRAEPQTLDWNNNLGFHGFKSLQVTASL